MTLYNPFEGFELVGFDNLGIVGLDIPSMVTQLWESTIKYVLSEREKEEVMLGNNPLPGDIVDSIAPLYLLKTVLTGKNPNADLAYMGITVTKSPTYGLLRPGILVQESVNSGKYLKVVGTPQNFEGLVKLIDLHFFQS